MRPRDPLVVLGSGTILYHQIFHLDTAAQRVRILDICLARVRRPYGRPGKRSCPGYHMEGIFSLHR